MREREIWRNRTWEIAGKEGGVCCSCLLPLASWGGDGGRWNEVERENELIIFYIKLIKLNNANKALPDHSWSLRDCNFARRSISLLNVVLWVIKTLCGLEWGVIIIRIVNSSDWLRAFIFNLMFFFK
jgi:hypothetical protein